MGFRFRKSIKIAPGVRINLGKKSAGISIGSRRAGISYNTKTGTRARVSLPGTGISYSEKIGGRRKSIKKRSNVRATNTRSQKSKLPVVQRAWYIPLACIFVIGGIGTLSKDVLMGLFYIAIGVVMFYCKSRAHHSKTDPADEKQPVTSAQPTVNAQEPHPESTVVLSKISLHTITNLRNLKDYVVIDLETTGLSSNQDKIIEVGILSIVNGQVAEEFDTLINPGIPIPPVASRTNGIYDADVKDAPRLEDIVQQIAAKLERNTIVGYNVSFDLSFISKAFTDAGLEITLVYGDVLQLARKAYPEYPNHKLQTVGQNLGICNAQTHRALDDCQLTYKVYEICRAKLLATHDAELAAKRALKKQQRTETLTNSNTAK